MIPAIGVTTQVIRRAKWYKFIGELGFNTIEINRQNSKLHFNIFFLEKVKRYMKGFDLSIHSGTAGVFQSHESFTKANLSILTAEIDVCSFLGARQFVFHLNDGMISTANKRRLKEVLRHAADLGVEMYYESNSALIADYAYDVLGSFPELGYVLDLGHLNNGHGKGILGCTMDEFITQVKSRVTYIHASNNCGYRDEHNGLESGTLDWRSILNMLDLSKIAKIIIEVRDIHMIGESSAGLMGYLEGELLAQRCCSLG